MKKYLNLTIAAMAVVVLLGSCKKSKAPGPANTSGSMSFSTNSTAISYNYCLATTVSVNDVVQTAILGNNVTSSGASNDSFEITINQDPAALKVGQTYPAGAAFTANENDAMLNYFPNQTDTYDSAVTSPQGSVIITGITSTTISGTFSGKLYAFDDTDGTQLKYTITGGKFTAIKNKN